MRTTKEVFQDHLEKRKNGKTEEDIKQNYSEDVILLTGTGIFRGHDGVRAAAADLKYYTKDATFTYVNTLVEGDYAFLEWHAKTDDRAVRDGADSFVVEDGKIIMQSIHYSVEENK